VASFEELDQIIEDEETKISMCEFKIIETM